VVLKIAVEMAKENASAASPTPRAILRRWRLNEAATVAESLGARGFKAEEMTERPRARAAMLTRMVNSPLASQKSSGARNAG
jgi:hypothetical protein